MECNFSTVAFHCFGSPIRWYSLAYIFGILGALKLSKTLLTRTNSTITEKNLEEFMNYCVLGIVLGGRLGFVLIYAFDYYSENPLEIVKVWKGGMSFFGGFCGTAAVALWFCKKRRIPFWEFMDLWSVSAPIGLFLGRIANFINAELLGKPTKAPWGVVFHDGVVRHPSQIYEAILEGLILLVVMILCFQKTSFSSYHGKLSGLFCVGYGVARFVAEFFREPDNQFSANLLSETGLNINQYICVVIVLLGTVLIRNSKSDNNHC
jgi:phosphatidylglycerol:prolipoprotein diacylglycerol transferase